MQPYGFDIGASESGIVLKGLDYGVEGMRVGGQVLLWSLSCPELHENLLRLCRIIF